MLIDAHSHVDFPQFDKDRDAILENSKKNGITIINSAMGPESVKKSLDLAKRYDNVLVTIGLSPTEFNEKIIEDTIELIKKHKGDIIGIGEVGLDYYWVKDQNEREKELRNFRRFIGLSQELNLPLLIHSRDAEKDAIDEIKKEGIPALLHCFSGTIEQAMESISFGCLISVPTSVVYSKKKQLLAKEIPLDSIVLESDAPYLSPVPKTRNEPLNIRLSAKKIAEIKGVDIQTIEKNTTNNANSFFNLKSNNK